MAMRFSHGANGLRLVEPRERSESLHERLLTRIVGQRPVRGDGVGRTPGENPIAVEERAGSLRRAFAGENDELGVRAAVHS